MSKAQQQAPLPQQIVLGLNAWNCNSKISNANWETKLNEQVNVDSGDSIFVKASYIDTRGSASGNIDLNVDTEISLDYYFYWIHTFNACKGSELYTAPSTLDGSANLVQQVLVGRDIPSLYTQNAIINPAFPHPAFPTVPAVDASWNCTNINDADALPYLVYQSTNNYPVPAVLGPIIPASQMVVGERYTINTPGITTNWSYAGLTTATVNILPVNFVLNSSYFTCTANPNGLDVPALSPIYDNPGIPPDAFLVPGNLNSPSLQHVDYIVSVVGDTDWGIIDPSLINGSIPASSMIGGRVYTISVPGTIDWTYWGSASNEIGQNFTATIPPAPPPVIIDIRITLNTAFFLANANLFSPASGTPFGADDDVFNCVIRVDTVTGDYVMDSFSGSGSWIEYLDPDAYWTIPGNLLDLSPGLNAGALTINGLSGGLGRVSVTECRVGVSYLPDPDNLGVVDGSNPQFTWAQISSFSDYPEDFTYFMTANVSYQVILDYGVVIPYAPNQGVLSDIFVSQGPILQTSQTYTNATPNINSIVTLVDNLGKNYDLTGSDSDALVVNIIINYDGPTGDYIYSSSSILGNDGTEPFAGAVTTLTLTILPNPLSFTRNTIVFTSSLFDGGFSSAAVESMTFVSGATPSSHLIEFPTTPTHRFTCTSVVSPSQNTTAKVLKYSLTTAVASGFCFTMGYCEVGGVQVGTVVKSFFPAAVPPGSGMAVLAPSFYDGTVRTIIPSTVKQDIRPVKKRWAMTLPKGSYDPNYLAELISRNMSRQKIKRVNNVQGGPFGTQSTANIPTDSVWNSVPNSTSDEWTTPSGLGSNTFYDSKNPVAYDYPPGLDYNLAPNNFDDMPFLFTPQMLGTTLHTNSNANDYVYATIPHKNANDLNNLPDPTYDITLVPLLNDVRSVSTTIPPSANTTDPYYSILPFYSQNNFSSETNSGNSGIFPVTFGATQTSLLYNNENNNLFAFNYLHSPILAFLTSTSTQLTECTAHMYTTNKKSTNMNNTQYFTSLIDKKSGILLNKMEPANFWNQLGFNISALTVDLDNKIGFQMTSNEFQAKTTGGFCGSSNIFNQNFKTVGSADQPSVADTELLYLTAVSNNGGRTLIDARGTPLTIGTEYTIFSPGVGEIEQQFPEPNIKQRLNAIDWTTYVGQPGPDYPNSGYFNPTGYTFTATSTGFPTGTFEIQNGDGTTSNATWYTDDGTAPPQVYLTNSPSSSTTTQLQNSYFTVNNTNTLNASGIPTQRDATGHYLIEITGYNSIYLDDYSKHEIKSVVSSYYVSANSFVSQPFPDSYNFFNYGAPISLSNIKVRILDPYTMQEAVIGPNSSVYLQVNKMLTDQAIQQVEN